MKHEELVAQLRKSGINARLVHKIHDEALIDIRSECSEIKIDMEKIWEALNKGSGVGFHHRTDSNPARPHGSTSKPSMDSDDTVRRHRQYPHEAPRGGRLRPTGGDTSKVSSRGKGRSSKG